jgi:hypothetical protein
LLHVHLRRSRLAVRIVSRCGEASDIKEGADGTRIGQVPADCIDGLLREIRLHIDVVDNSLGLTGD